MNALVFVYFLQSLFLPHGLKHLVKSFDHFKKINIVIAAL